MKTTPLSAWAEGVMTAGFGIEKLGLLSLRYPWLSILVIALITPIMAFGASRLEFSSDIREIFRSNDAAFKKLDVASERFPGSQRHLHVVVESEEPFEPKELTVLRALGQDLERLDGVDEVLSIFSAVAKPDGGEPLPLFPEDFSEIEDYDALRKETSRHPIVGNRLLSDD